MGEIKGVEKITHPNIYAALSALQAELKPIKKSKTVEFDTSKGGKVKYSYTPLEEIMDTLYPLLGKHGLSVRHQMVNEGGRDGVIAIVTHETYEETQVVIESVSTTDTTTTKYGSLIKNQIKSGVIKIPTSNEMKSNGEAITYARRYSLTMVIGISSEDDLDVALIQESGKNAIQFAFNRVKQGLETAKMIRTIDSTYKVLNDDYKLLESGKVPTLGLNKEQYEELIMLADKRREELGGSNDTGIKPKKK